jgi:hypothetical protein
MTKPGAGAHAHRWAINCHYRHRRPGFRPGDVAARESNMTYAVFRDGDRISRPFETQGDAWDCADDAGLVENVAGDGGSVQVLDSHCTIKSCIPEFVMPANLA